MYQRMLAKMMVPAIALAMLAVALSPAVPNASANWVFDWDTETSMGDPASQAVVVGSPDGIVYIIGGVEDLGYVRVASTYSYDTNTGDWTTLAPMTAAERGACGAMGHDGLVYVFGGDDFSGYTQIYDPEADDWSMGADMLYPVWEAKAATVGNGSIWVVGGEGAPSPGYAQIYDPVADSWSVGTPAPVDVLCGAMISDGDDLYYSGGGVGDYTAFGYFFKYDSAGDEWVTLADLPQARAAHAMVMGADGLIYVIGGGEDGYNTGFSSPYDSVDVYDPATDMWTAGPRMDYERKYLGAATTSDGRIWAFGGNTLAAVSTAVESLQTYLFDYTIELSSSSARAGETVLLMLDATYTYVEEYYQEMSWYLIGDSDGVVYAGDGMWISVPDAVAIEISIPALAPAGDYTVVVDYWVTYAEGTYEIVEMVELPLEVLAAPLPADELIAALEEQIAALEGQIADLQDELETLNASVMDEVSALQDQLSDLEDSLAALEASVGSDNQDLMDEISALQDQIESLQDSLNTVQTSVDDKADNTMLYAIIGLLVVVIVLMIVMMVMGRKTVPPPPAP